MFRNKANSFEKLCDVLEANVAFNRNENEITYVRKYLEIGLKISEDKDMLLKIKAEAEDSDYDTVSMQVISLLAMFFAAIGIFIQLFPKMSEVGDAMTKLGFFVIIIIVLTPSLKLFGGKYRPVRKWRKYILCVVNQLIENYSDDQIEKMDKQIEKKKKDNKNRKVERKSDRRK